jgi:protein-tyrosine phosphatase
MAEKVFTAALAEAGLDGRVSVSSAGTGGWHVGEPMDSRAAKTLRDNGYDDAHVARQVDSGILSADLLVALDAEHLRGLRDSVPEPDRVRLLRSFDPASADDAEVPDPYYGGPDGFGEVLAMIEAAVPGLVEQVEKRL